jgi:hypothetical protein
MKAMHSLYDHESEQMLDFLEDSRADIKKTAKEIQEEQEVLKETSGLLGTFTTLTERL